MKVELLNKPTLEYVDTGVGMCWGKGGYGADTEKGKERIERVCNKFRHASMLRFATYIFKVELSTSALLEWTRHQHADYAVKSTRYCTKQNPDAIRVELSNDEAVNTLLVKHMAEIIDFIKENPSKSNDDLKLLLPQGFIYEMQVQFNAQALQHFLALRTAKSAHYHIRELANEVFIALPEDHKYLFIESLYKEHTDESKHS
jgi:thymidylate synthase (FAD)